MTDTDMTADVLHTLTSFETFDALAGPDRQPTDVTPLIIALAEAALRLPAMDKNAQRREPTRPPDDSQTAPTTAPATGYPPPDDGAPAPHRDQPPHA